jgi:dTDP-glucose 4,6-dehydratase
VRVVVTGGAGFIGSEFVRAVAQDRFPALAGAEVVVLDKLTYAGNPANLAPVEGTGRVRLVVGDICDRAFAGDVLGEHGGADLVVHFAAESHVDRSIAGAADFVVTNVVGTQTLLDAALSTGVGRFVHVSTDEVYGTIATGSWTEDRPLEPNSPYSASKASSDLIARSYARTHGLDVVITRCSNNYGPYQYPEKVIPLFVTNLLEGRSVPLYGEGANIRDWLHVADHCAGIALVAAGGRAGEVYNIGGGTELSNLQLTEQLLVAAGATAADGGPDWSRVERVPDRKGHDLRYSVDITKISEELGYAPAVPFAQGLAETVQWYRSHPEWWQPLRAGAGA